VLLAGEPGIGKSRLLRALRDALDPEPHMALRHQCSPYHTHTALHPVIEQLERAAGFEREEAAEARLAKLQTLLARGEPDMTRTAALLADLLGIEAGSRHSPPQLTARQQKESTFAALLDQLVALAARALSW
jgi:predicted ATPase